MSPGKLGTEPLLLLLVAALFSWMILAFRTWRPARASQKGMLALLGASLGCLIVLSLPVTARLIEESLVIATPDPEAAPDAIVVLAGGYTPEARGRLLSPDSTIRVMAAIDWWRRYPSARLVMSGGSSDGPDARFSKMTDLMAEMAESGGVPSDRILKERMSRNTREHPREVLGLPGFTPETKIGLVTSRWHLRRATIEFARHFHAVSPLGYEVPSRNRRARDWIPSAGALGHSTKMIHEWIGIVWYRVLAAADH